jgi:hypothetical protein
MMMSTDVLANLSVAAEDAADCLLFGLREVAEGLGALDADQLSADVLAGKRNQMAKRFIAATGELFLHWRTLSAIADDLHDRWVAADAKVAA